MILANSSVITEIALICSPLTLSSGSSSLSPSSLSSGFSSSSASTSPASFPSSFAFAAF